MVGSLAFLLLFYCGFDLAVNVMYKLPVFLNLQAIASSACTRPSPLLVPSLHRCRRAAVEVVFSISGRHPSSRCCCMVTDLASLVVLPTRIQWPRWRRNVDLRNI